MHSTPLIVNTASGDTRLLKASSHSECVLGTSNNVYVRFLVHSVRVEKDAGIDDGLYAFRGFQVVNGKIATMKFL